jgi:hypothetical protein
VFSQPAFSGGVLTIGAKSQEPEARFLTKGYLAINDARLRHLESLLPGVAAPGAGVLEVAVGIGDLTPFWIDRGFDVACTEGRAENIAVFRRRYPAISMVQHDLEGPEPLPGPYDIVHAYGILYHLRDPARGLAQLASATRDVLFLETCVSFGDGAPINNVNEPAIDPTQALGGTGCRPTRPWLYQTLKSHFPHVYLPRTQPDHPQFPTDWTGKPPADAPLTRSVFVASRRPIASADLVEALLMRQERIATAP